MRGWMVGFVICLAMLGTQSAMAGSEKASTLLGKFDEIMAPESAQMKFRITVDRPGRESRRYLMTAMKKGESKSRIYFEEPSAAAGQEILRSGDNVWLYLPNMKRATSLAGRSDFMGGDFSNADILRSNLSADYEAKGLETQGGLDCLDLHSKTSETPYARVVLCLRKSDSLPVSASYYGTSGKKMRRAEFSEYKKFDGGHRRPARVVMFNELVKGEKSTLEVISLKVGVDFPDRRFLVTDLGN